MYSKFPNIKRKKVDTNEINSKYDGNGLQQVVLELFTHFRKIKKMLRPLVISAHSPCKKNETLLLINDNEFAEWSIAEAIVAATSAPYFFPQY